MDVGRWFPPPPGRSRPPRETPPRPDVPPARARSARRLALIAVAVLVAAVFLAAQLAGGIAPISRMETGSSDDYRFLRRLPNGQPYRWDPCVPIHYEVNLTDAPLGAIDDVREAIARLADASGYRFVFDGMTTRTVDEQIGRAFQTGTSGPRWFPVLIAWVPHEHFDYLADTDRASAFGMPRTGDGSEYATYRSGVVAIDVGDRLPSGFDLRFSRGVVLMHELGHVMGLGHVAAGDELMWSPQVRGADRSPDLGLNDWGPGDRHGLEILGEHAPCPTASVGQTS